MMTVETGRGRGREKAYGGTVSREGGRNGAERKTEAEGEAIIERWMMDEITNTH